MAVADLAARAECAQSTVYDNIAKGRIAASRWRGLIVIAPDAADAFLSLIPVAGAVDEGGAQ
jgi:hypothetical protein